FGTTAIIDTGASACCINKKVIPEEALEPLTQNVVFNGLNLRQQATHRIKQGYFLIEENKFKIPLIYAFELAFGKYFIIFEMHRRNEGISNSSSLLSRGSSTVPQCLSEEYEDYLRRSHEDFQPLPRIFTKTIFTPEEPGALYKRSVAQDLELLAAKEAVKVMRNLQAIIQCKAQICFGQSTKDNHWSDQREDVRVQNKEARRILIELEALAQRLGRNNI
ncbi:Orf y, partial [Tanacetum coccineum]